MTLAFAARSPADEFIHAHAWVVPVFVVVWTWLLTQFVAWLSGWSRLAEQYRAPRPVEGEKWRFQSVQMRYLSHYNNCVTFVAAMQGLSIAMFPLFRLSHPPLLIPWEELQIQPQKRFLVSGYELRFLRVPGIPMWVRSSLGEKLLRAGQAQGSGIRMSGPIG